MQSPALVLGALTKDHSRVSGFEGRRLGRRRHDARCGRTTEHLTLADSQLLAGDLAANSLMASERHAQAHGHEWPQ